MGTQNTRRLSQPKKSVQSWLQIGLRGISVWKSVAFDRTDFRLSAGVGKIARPGYRHSLFDGNIDHVLKIFHLTDFFTLRIEPDQLLCLAL